MTIITNSYPNATAFKIAEVYKPNDGWIKLWPHTSVELNPNNIIKAKDEGATWVNVYLIDEFGVERYPDYTVKELISSFTQ